LIGLLKDPEKLGKFIDVTKSLLGHSQPSYIGNINRLNESSENNPASLSPSSNSAANIPSEEKLQRLGVAIDTLEKSDPMLVDHLEKLAKIAVENPRQFLQLISMIDVF
jgi:hypothetical protein